MPTVQICCYVQELRRAAEQEVALRMRKHSPSPVSRKDSSEQQFIPSGGIALAPLLQWN
jgi:hypothetical protein